MTVVNAAQLKAGIQRARTEQMPQYMNRVVTQLRADFSRQAQYPVNMVADAMRSQGAWGAQVLSVAGSEEALGRIPEILRTHGDFPAIGGWFSHDLFEKKSGNNVAFDPDKESSFRKVLSAAGQEMATQIVTNVYPATIHDIALGLNDDSANYYFDMLSGEKIASACVRGHTNAEEPYDLSSQAKTLLGLMKEANLAKLFPFAAGQIVVGVKHHYTGGDGDYDRDPERDEKTVLTREDFYSWASSGKPEDIASRVAGIWGSDYAAGMAEDNDFNPPTMAQIFRKMLGFERTKKVADILSTFGVEKSADILGILGVEGVPAYSQMDLGTLSRILALVNPPALADEIIEALEK